MMDKAGLKKILSQCKVVGFTEHRVGENTQHLHVYNPEDEGAEAEARTAMNREMKKALAKGSSVTRPDGNREWIRVSPEVHFDADGHEQYVWDKPGDRIRCTRERCIRTPDGEMTRTKMSPVYRSWAAAWGDK
jgi:hypothetical protein